jgi:DNA-binding SARP family transcriptional activator
MIDFGILGPLEVRREGQLVPVRGAKQRALLAALLLRANEIVSTDRLVDDLWGEEPPEAGAAALRVRVSQLRKALEVGSAGNPIVTQPSGYVLQLEPGRLDLHRFELLAREAEGSEASIAAEKLREALSLWRGAALAEFASEPFAEPAIARLDELRLATLEKRVEADLALGRHADLVAELQALTAEHPLRERLRGQLMLALYRSGRQAEALAAYRDGRETLVGELGIEPSPSLQELERAILAQDRSLDLEPRPPAKRAILAVVADAGRLEDVLALAVPLARRSSREVILAQVAHAAALDRTAALLHVVCEGLRAEGVDARSAAFTAGKPGADTVRLATEQDVDLILVAATSELLEDPVLAELMHSAPCDVAALIGEGPTAGPVLVPFTGAEHDWTAIEVGAWLASSWEVSLRLAGPLLTDGRDASRLLANASLAVQRALGVAAEPLLVEPSPDGLAAAGRGAAIAVVGLSDRWREEGLGPARATLAGGDRPALLVRRGVRPGGLAPPESHTRFTWSLKPA